jgi:hypothetical protein
MEKAAIKLYRACVALDFADCECDPLCPYADGGDADDCNCDGGNLRGALFEFAALAAQPKEVGK